MKLDFDEIVYRVMLIGATAIVVATALLALVIIGWAILQFFV